MMGWTRKNIEQVNDQILLNSVAEFRHALFVVDHSPVSAHNQYIDLMRKGLRLMEEELQERGLQASPSIPNASGPVKLRDQLRKPWMKNGFRPGS